MPKAVHDLAIKLQGKGKSEDSAWAIANSQLGKTTKNDKNLGEMMQDQSPSMTNLKPSPQNTGGWPTSQNPGFGNTMGQMREDGAGFGGGMGGGASVSYAEPAPCDICGGPEHPPMDHPYLPRMPNDPMAMTQQPQMPQMPMPMPQPPMAQMQAPMPQPQMPQMSQQPPMQTNPAQTQKPPGQEEGGMGSGRIPSGGGGQMGAPSGGGQSGGGDGGSGGGGEGGGQGGFGGQRPAPGPIMSFETVKMNETIMKQLIDRKVGCGCRKTKKG